MISPWPSLWEKTCSLYLERPALDLHTQTLTYADLALRADHLRKQISKDKSIGAGSIIAVPVDNPDFLIPFIACWNLGATVVPYSRVGVEDRPIIKEFLESASDLWLDGEYLPSISKKIHRCGHNIQGIPLDRPLHAIYFTSGSTGGTKGVLRGWKQAIHEAKCYARVLKLKPGDRTVTLINPTFGASTKQVLGGLLSGCCQSFPRLIRGGMPLKDGYVIYGTPSHFSAMDVGEFANPHFHWVSMTGEAPNINALEAARKLIHPNGKILNALGGTEFGVLYNQIMSASPDDAILCSRSHLKKLAILDETGTRIRGDTPGRLRVTSAYLAEGYIEYSPRNDNLIFSPFQKTPDGQFSVLTGDIASLSSEGVLKVIGRSNAMVKMNGKWLDTSPLKHHLEVSRWIEQYVIDHDEMTGKMRVGIYPIGDLSHAQIKAECLKVRNGLEQSELRTIPFYRIPELPRNPNGKLDLLKIKNMDLECLVPEVYDRTEIVDVVNYLLHGHSESEVRLDQVTLMELGIDSIELIEIATSIQRMTGKTISLSTFLMPLPLKNIRTALWKEFKHESWPLQLGLADSPGIILWFGFAGIIPVRQQFGHQCQILYWDCDHSLLLESSQGKATMESLARHHFNMTSKKPLPSRIVVGGFSFGASMAHEVTHQFESNGVEVDLTVLLDPIYFGIIRTNTPGRFVRDLCLSLLRHAMPQKYIGANLGRLIRKSIRQQALTNLRPKSVNASLWIQTTERKRKFAERLFDKTDKRIQWEHADTPRHLDLMTDHALIRRWIDIIQKWADERLGNANIDLNR